MREESSMTPIFLLWKLDRQLLYPEKMRIFRLGEVDVRNDVLSFINSAFETLMGSHVVLQVRIHRTEGAF